VASLVWATLYIVLHKPNIVLSWEWKDWWRHQHSVYRICIWSFFECILLLNSA